MIVHYFILNVFLITIVTQAAVVDQEPPVFTNCPKDFVKDDLTCLEVRVNWQQPTVTDNSGVAPSVTSNRHSGDLFAVPSTSEVIYTATDAAGNTATCSFKITLKMSCPKGKYGSPCQECQPSTYKDFVGHAAACTPCPVNSVHPITGSVTIQDCRCLPGFAGAPQQGTPCTIRHCESLPVPANGLFVGQCSNEYLSVCRMTCTDGYEATGSEERTCQVTANDAMAWSGTPMTCVVIRCPVLAVTNADPPTGDWTSPSGAPAVDVTYNTRCTFTCRRGYGLKGDKERVCQLDKTWSGQSTTCEIVRCPSLIVANADPPTGFCPSSDLIYNTVCIFTCMEGYQLKGDMVRVCEIDKTWAGQSTTCER